MVDFSFENEKKSMGYSFIAGVDEVGRGCLAGPVVAAAVILPDNCSLSGIDDSKKLSAKQRESAADYIKRICISYGISEVCPQKIDEINIRNASFLAMKKAVEALSFVPGYVLVDGCDVKYINLPHQCLVRGDSKSASIAAASILAKVYRDKAMCDFSSDYPMYGFEKNKGYPTKLHYDSIKKFGLTPLHRKSFRLF